jgi:YVTN family beta-propeller protein
MMRTLPFLLAALAWAQTANLAIVEKKAGQVGFYTAEGKRLGGVKVGEHPHEIIPSPDRKLAYVSDNGILWMQYAGEGGNTISIVDLVSRTKAGVIDLGNNRRPHGMDIDPRTNRMVVTTENPDGLVLIDLAQRRVLRRYDVKGEDPHMVILEPGGEWAYVSNTSSATIAALRLSDGHVQLIPTDARPQGGVFTHDGKTLYITNSDGNSISIIDVARKERIGRIATGIGPGRVALTPDGKTLVYNLQPGEGAGFADVAGRKQVAEIRLPGKPLSLIMSRDGKYAYAGLQDSDKVAIISIADRKLLRVFDTPKEAGPDPVFPLD